MKREILGFLICFPLSAWAGPNFKAVSNLLKPYKNEVGFSVRSFSGKEFLDVNGTQSMTPASVAKLVSTACAIETLGPEFQFRTKFGYTGQIEAGVLEGNLVVQGVGDPSFVIEELRQVVDMIRTVQEVKEIRGKIIFDLSYFGRGTMKISNGFEGDEGRSFAAGLTPLAFNHNSFAVWIAPDETKPRVHLVPDGAVELKVVSQVVSSKGSSSNISIDYSPAESTLKVSGRIGVDAEPKAIYRAVDDVYASFARVFARIWRDSGGIWKTPAYDFSAGRVASKTLWTQTSRSLSRILLDINKLSTNFGAELIAIGAAEKKYGRPVTEESVQKYLRDCLWSYGFSEEKAKLTNASGLSRETKIAASQLTQILIAIQGEDFFPEYLSSLSILGKDGTTRSRLKEFAGRGRLKTGSIRGVRSIAGYLTPEKSEGLAFALFFNSPKLDEAKAVEVEDKVLEALLGP